MELKNVFIFTSDSKNGQLLELNASGHSAVYCLNKQFKTDDVLHSHVKRYLEKELPEYTISPMTGHGGMNTGILDRIDELLTYFPGIKNDKTLFVRGFNTGANVGNIDKERLSHFMPNALIENNDATISKTYADKSVLFKLIEKSDTKRTPKTKNYSVNSITAQNAEIDFSGCSHVIIKPVDALQGQGVIVVEQEHCKKVIDAILLGKPSSAAPYIKGKDKSGLNYWKDNASTTIQVQEFVQASLYQHEGKKWDATDRHLWSVIHQQDNNGKDVLKIECHGGFKKLPETSITNNGPISQESAISVSERSFIKKIVKYISAEKGSGDKVFIESKDDVNIKPLADDLLSIFKTAVKTDIEELASEHAWNKYEQPKKSRPRALTPLNI
jgi:hypothetical protein